MAKVREYERYHGVVLTRLIRESQGRVQIGFVDSSDNSSYEVIDNIGLYIKYSTKRMSPWAFTFHPRHQDEIAHLIQKYRKVYLALICGEDGIALLDSFQFRKVLDEEYSSSESISVSRRRSGMYSIRGTDGALKFKIARQDFPKRILQEYQGL